MDRHFSDLPLEAQQSAQALLDYLVPGHPSQRDPYYLLVRRFVHGILAASPATAPDTVRTFLAQRNALLGAHDRAKYAPLQRAPRFTSALAKNSVGKIPKGSSE
jgi:hypothetical protein